MRRVETKIIEQHAISHAQTHRCIICPHTDKTMSAIFDILKSLLDDA